MQRTARNNQDALTILDVLYGNAALKRLAIQTMIDLIQSWTKESYYMQQAREQEVAEARATRTAKNALSKLRREQGEIQRQRGDKKEAVGT